MRLLNISTPCRGGVVFLLLVNNCRSCKLVKPHRVNEWMETVVISTRSCYRTEIILRYRNYFLAFTVFYSHDCWPFFFCFVFVQLFQGNLLSDKPVCKYQGEMSTSYCANTLCVFAQSVLQAPNLCRPALWQRSELDIFALGKVIICWVSHLVLPRSMVQFVAAMLLPIQSWQKSYFKFHI